MLLLLAICCVLSGTLVERNEAASKGDPKILAMGDPNNPGDINPLIGKNIVAEYVDINVYDTLVGRGKKMSKDGYLAEDPDQLVSKLAREWKVSGDGLTYTFVLRGDVKFHNGSSFNAEDVAFTFNLLRSTGSYASFYRELISKVTVLDKDRIEIRLNRVDPRFLSRISSYHGCILDKETVTEKGGAAIEGQMKWLAANAIGTGPFTLEELKTDTVRLRANKGYWAGAPGLDGVVIKTIPETGNRKMMLERGDLHLITNPSSTDYAALEKNQDLDLVVRPGNSKVYYFGFNCDYPPFKDVRVRQAIAHAIPYDAMRQTLMGGDRFAPRARSLITSDLPGYAPGVTYEYDLERAKQLLKEAGYEKGLDLQFDLFNVPTFNKAAVMLQAELKKIGVNVSITPMAPPVFFKAGDAGKLNFFIVSWWDDTADPVGLLQRIVHSKAIPAQGNWAQFSNAEADGLIDRLAKEMDPQRKLDPLKSVQKILSEKVPYAPVWEGRIIFAARKKVKGFVHYTDALFRFYDLSMED
jgi:peptide/nickel transport system substrate-binding protein